MTQLLFVFGIVLAGVLFRARMAVITSVTAACLFLLIALLQAYKYIDTDTSWLSRPLEAIDAIGCVAIFIITGLVTWLANTEIDRALARARASEASLAEERDSLEIKVQERTQELEAAHLVRLMELQRFAELGRLSASLLHDIADPLTVASLNVGQLHGRYQPNLVQQVGQSLRHIERYVEAARKQLLVGGDITAFKVRKEIEQVLSIVAHTARKHDVKVYMNVPKQLTLTGDAVKFSQLISNLVLNAIEAYDSEQTEIVRTVQVAVVPYYKGVSVTVKDFGKGLTSKEKDLIFQSFYTTKSHHNRNMGIGLSLAKQIVEQDFNGRLSVESSPKKGTIFTAKLFSTKHET